MRNLQAEVSELFAEFENNEAEMLGALHWRQHKAELQAAYDAERAKLIRCVPALRNKRTAQLQKYNKKKWQQTKANPVARAAHNKRRMAAYARLKADPERLAIAKAKQAIHSRNHAKRKRESDS